MSKRYDIERGSSAQRGYGYKWQQAREGWLRSHPLCEAHKRKGQVAVAEVVDHIVPHKGDMKLFWDRDNWQSLCKLCHDGDKQRLEKSGRVAGCDASGVPVDPNHHWNK
ncbi:MAG: HNH endonuclease [Methylobacter sp.]